MQFLIDNFNLLWDAFLTTLSISALAGLVALVLGTLLAAARVSPIPPLRGLATFYVETFRNTPLTVVFFFLIFGLPQIDFVLGFFPGAVLSLGLYTAAFVCEAVRSGINAISTGQAEASRAIGLTFGQSLREVVLPQAFRTVVPPLGNVFIAMVKNSSIAAGFAVSELSSLLPRLVNANAAQLSAVLVGVVVAYMLITLPLAFLVHHVERRVAILR
ncbi:amino acid ABC transporter permease [Geodermatophilus sp. YIM 151500]|uniref:amino acid ABC transporter permease n=1 Tax=Geodermatophilus sp. YIM 151500 TaxID=2984531 RepID=UPI0021E3BA50|nr:amino acid ABC transporter permease [Geodermatophilus sp. YIM 151500]MCV2488400.1 amino acid ABC transporter permease [Geodermatophilus sp. YIM 151500]